jgi:hypothetical protein
MKFTVTSLHMDSALEDGFTDRRLLTNAVDDAIAGALKPVKVAGLRDLDTTWLFPAPKRKKKPEVTDVRYTKKSGKIFCRFIMSPAVGSNTPAWPAYRVSFVEQSAAMMGELFAVASQRLQKNGHDGDLSEAERAVAGALSNLRKKYAGKAAKK